MKKNSLRFHDLFLRSEFILHFPCRVKNMFLIILVAGSRENYRWTMNFKVLVINASLTMYYLQFYQWNCERTLKNLEGFFKILVRNENFKVELQRE